MRVVVPEVRVLMNRRLGTYDVRVEVDSALVGKSVCRIILNKEENTFIVDIIGF